MIDLQDIQRVYFIGIGGIGMSALARYFHENGVVVSGYDRAPTRLTTELEQSGIAIHYQEDVSMADPEADLVVYTPAIPATHAELAFYREKEYPVWKRSDVLQEITKELFSITVAGTHGKTTISCLIAHILRHSGYGCNAFLGGISVNYNRNFWSSERKVAVIEADEYDRSFLKLSPDIAILTAMDADHLDIYGTENALQEAFIQYANQTNAGGTLFYKHGLKRSGEFKVKSHYTYSLQNEAADIYANNIQMRSGGYEFDVIQKDWLIDNLALQVGGMHNVENAVVAIAVAHQLGIENEKIRTAIADFKGVKRRFEYITRNKQTIYIDDYAHHPEELKTLINSARALFPGRKCTIIFQPHLFSRTRDLATEFTESLRLADEVILLPIYPAREQPIENVNSELITNKLPSGKVMSKESYLEWLKKNPVELLITAGAGDIDQLVEPIATILNNKK